MIARAYFQLVDAIAAAHTDDEVAELRARVDATAMHPFERRALERQLRSRARPAQGRHSRETPPHTWEHKYTHLLEWCRPEFLPCPQVEQ